MGFLSKSELALADCLARVERAAPSELAELIALLDNRAKKHKEEFDALAEALALSPDNPAGKLEANKLSGRRESLTDIIQIYESMKE